MCELAAEWSEFIRTTYSCLQVAQSSTIKAMPSAGSTGPTQADFEEMMRGQGSAVRELCEALGNGDLSPQMWAQGLDDAMRLAHTSAWRMGRNLAGNFDDESLLDALMGIAAKDGDADRLLTFLDQLRNGDSRYVNEDGSFRVDQIWNRSSMYVMRARGTANEAFLEKSDAEDLFDWVLGGTEDNCRDCPELAAMGAVTRDELITTPGACGTPCLTNCLCYLVRSDGVQGFSSLRF